MTDDDWEELSETIALHREHKLAEEALDQQTETLRTFSDNATRMLRITLLSIAGLAAGGVLTTGLPNPFVVNYCLSLLTTLGFFIGVFFLVSATLGIGTSADQPVNPGDIESTVEDSSGYRDYLTHRLRQYQTRLDYNERVINASRSLLFLADIVLSVSFGLLMFLAVAMAGYLTWWLPLATVVILLVLLYIIDSTYPPDHDARILPPRDETEQDDGGESRGRVYAKVGIVVILVLGGALLLPHCGLILGII